LLPNFLNLDTVLLKLVNFPGSFQKQIKGKVDAPIHKGIIALLKVGCSIQLYSRFEPTGSYCCSLFTNK